MPFGERTCQSFSQRQIFAAFPDYAVLAKLARKSEKMRVERDLLPVVVEILTVGFPYRPFAITAVEVFQSVGCGFQFDAVVYPLPVPTAERLGLGR